MDKSIKIKNLDNLNIHKLRDIAREVGVRSPASLTKKDLLIEIYKIYDGDAEPYYNKTKVGRPVKEGSELELFEFVKNIDLKKTDINYDFTPNALAELKLCEPDPETDANMFKIEKNYNGFIDVQKSGFGLLRLDGVIPSSDDPYIPSRIVDKFNLRSGDKIIGLSKKFNPESVPIIYGVIENIGVSPNRKKCFDEQKSIPNKQIDVNFLDNELQNLFKNKISLGSSYYLYGANNDKFETMLQNLSNELSNKNLEIYNVSVNCEKLGENNFCKSGIKSLHLPYYLTDAEKVVSLRTYIEIVKRNVEEKGINAVIIINGLSAVLRSYDYALKGKVSNEVAVEAISRVQYFLISAKNIENGSITLIMLDDQNVPNAYKEIMEFDIVPHIHHKIKLN